jgi:predicted secreted protein
MAAYGTTLEYAGGSEIGELTSIGGVKLTADELDLTHHGSPGKFREVIQGLRDGGDLAIEGNLVPDDAGQAALLVHYNTDEDGGIEAMMVTYPDGSTWEFSAFVKELDFGNAPVDGKLDFSATLRISGLPEFTPAGS